MEKTIINFISENIMAFVPLLIIGIGSTLYLYFTGTKDGDEIPDKRESDHIEFLNHRFNVYILIYLFIVVMMILLGFASAFYEPVIVGGLLALIPIVLVICFNKGKHYQKT